MKRAWEKSFLWNSLRNCFWLFDYLYACLSISLYNFFCSLFLSPSIYLFTYMVMYLSIYSSIYLYIYVCLSFFSFFFSFSLNILWRRQCCACSSPTTRFYDASGPWKQAEIDALTEASCNKDNPYAAAHDLQDILQY